MKKVLSVLTLLCVLAGAAFANSGYGAAFGTLDATITSENGVVNTIKSKTVALNVEGENLLGGIIGFGTNVALGTVTSMTTASGAPLQDGGYTGVIPFPVFVDETIGVAIRLPVVPLIHITGLAGVHITEVLKEQLLMTAGVGAKAAVEFGLGPLGIRAGLSYANDWINILGLISDEYAGDIKQKCFMPYVSVVLKN